MVLWDYVPSAHELGYFSYFAVTAFLMGKDQPADYPFGGGSLLLGKASISDRLLRG